ncbi:hypothetical protein PQX77_005972 [Marasmius sp. AFHP31]|nr:hypothetical protein PQX77_005972 [Marasmius sp. AFHP31]
MKSQSSQCTPETTKVQLPDVRKEAREAALRARGLLPPLAPSDNASTTTATPEVAPTQSITTSQSGETATDTNRSIASPDERSRETEHIARPGSPTLSEVSETETLVGVPGVNPTIHTNESIWRLANEIEDEETRRLTMVAYMG